MKGLIRSEKGFTLVELMIVIVIVGILAAVAIPIYQANVKSAKASEAEAALGTIRTALRVYKAANGSYPVAATATPIANLNIDISASDLDGKYFKAGSYTYLSADGISYTLTATGADSIGSGGITRTMDQDGNLN
ncbi:MAG: type IV pilin protein [Fidelibacterota bacterium]